MNWPHIDQLQALLTNIQRESHVPGISVTIGRADNQLAAVVGKAAMDRSSSMSPESRFEMSCLMKFFLSLVSLCLWDNGEVDLYTPITEVIPELVPCHIRCGPPIRICHLLSHTSGYRGLDITDMRVRWNLTWEHFVRFFHETDQSFVPGTVFNYEHSEHVVLGELLRRITGESAQQLVQRLIFDPLGICPKTTAETDSHLLVANHVRSSNSTTYVPAKIAPFSNFWAASLPDWTITPSEICKVARALIGAERQRIETRPFRASVLERLQLPITTIPRGVNSSERCEDLPISFSISCAEYSDGYFGHNGSALGQTCGLRFNIKSGNMIVVGVSAWAPHVRDRVIRQIDQLLSGNVHIPRARSHSEFSLNSLCPNLTLDGICGQYLGSYMGEVTVSRTSDGLIIVAGRHGTRKKSFWVKQVRPGIYTIDSDVPVSIYFHAIEGQIALFLGVHSYKRSLNRVLDSQIKTSKCQMINEGR